MGSRKRPAPGRGSSRRQMYALSFSPWMTEGTHDDPLFSIRKEKFFHNLGNLPFVSAPWVVHTDGSNAHGMGNKNSIGGTYVTWAWNNQAVQRRRDSIHIATLSSPGCSSEGEMDMLCKIAGAFQRGCIASARVQLPSGTWGLVEVRLYA